MWLSNPLQLTRLAWTLFEQHCHGFPLSLQLVSGGEAQACQKREEGISQMSRHGHLCSPSTDFTDSHRSTRQ